MLFLCFFYFHIILLLCVLRVFFNLFLLTTLSFCFYLINNLYSKIVTNWLLLPTTLTHVYPLPCLNCYSIQTFGMQHIWQRKGKKEKILYLLVVWEKGERLAAWAIMMSWVNMWISNSLLLFWSLPIFFHQKSVNKNTSSGYSRGRAVDILEINNNHGRVNLYSTQRWVRDIHPPFTFSFLTWNLAVIFRFASWSWTCS